MANETHSVTVSKVNENCDTGKVHVPASVQRSEGICIDTDVEVTVAGLDGLMTQVSFIGTQKAGDYVTVPAELVRTAEMDLPGQFDVSFEAIEDEDDADDSDVVVSDDDVPDEVLDDGQESVESEPEAEESEEGLGELFAG